MPLTVSRRTVLQGAAASVVSGGLAIGTSSGAGAASRGGPAPAPGDWGAFDAAVGSAFDRLKMVGAAVAVVSADAVLHTKTFGVRSLQGRKPVTTRTAFRVGSVTKSMTAALVGTYVDDGTLTWDTKAVDAYPGFRAPTDGQTRSLRVRDLLGMASGLGDYPQVVAGLHFGDPTAAQLLQSVVNLPTVAGGVDREFFYNNTVQATGGYLPLLATGTKPGDLVAAYAAALEERVLKPAGMTGARVLDDPRGVLDDYADGHGLDLRLRPAAVPFVPIGAFSPAGSVMAGLDDMAAWARLQLRRGRSVTGARVVSEQNLTETWKRHVVEPVADANHFEAASYGYGMGWWETVFTDGTRMVAHSGDIDGFLTWTMFLPDHDLGLVVLNTMSGVPTGVLFDIYVAGVLLAMRAGIDGGAAPAMLAKAVGAMGFVTDLGGQAHAVDVKAVEPWLGRYEGGWSMVREGRQVSLRIGPRVWPLLGLPDGGYVVSEGPFLTTKVRLSRDPDGTPRVDLVGLESVRRTTG